MIFDSIEHLAIYQTVLPQLDSVISLLGDGNLDLTKGAHTTLVPGLRYNVAEYTTTDQPKEYEIHVREVDVQVMLQGEERIMSARRELAETAGPYDALGDASMVQGPENAGIVLQEGDFAIYFPGEPHKPGVAVGSSLPVKKVIFKIAL